MTKKKTSYQLTRESLFSADIMPQVLSAMRPYIQKDYDATTVRMNELLSVSPDHLFKRERHELYSLLHTRHWLRAMLGEVEP